MKGLIFLFLVIFGQNILDVTNGVSMDQFKQSLNMMRSICSPKHKVTVEMLDDLRKGNFAENQELKCYTKCIAQMAGTLTKKGEISHQRMAAQIDVIIPPELQGVARKALDHCKDTQKSYKDSCDKTFYLTKCVYEFSPEDFYFP